MNASSNHVTRADQVPAPSSTSIQSSSIICRSRAEFLSEVEELFYTYAFQPAGSSEWVVDRGTLDTLVTDLARHTHPAAAHHEDRAARDELVRTCQQACTELLHLGVDGHVTLLSLVASLFRVLAPASC